MTLASTSVMKIYFHDSFIGNNNEKLIFGPGRCDHSDRLICIILSIHSVTQESKKIILDDRELY